MFVYLKYYRLYQFNLRNIYINIMAKLLNFNKSQTGTFAIT